MNSKIPSIYWKNWEKWSEGGLSEPQLSSMLTKSDEHTLRIWLEPAIESGYLLPINSKNTIDLATWCIFSTDNLTDLPPDMRSYRLTKAAGEFQVGEASLIKLITSTTKLVKDYE